MTNPQALYDAITRWTLESPEASFTALAAHVGVKPASLQALKNGAGLSKTHYDKIFEATDIQPAFVQSLTNVELPIAPASTPWNASSARSRVREYLRDADRTLDAELYAACHLMSDPDGPEGLFVDVIDDTLSIIPDGLISAASRVKSLDVADDASQGIRLASAKRAANSLITRVKAVAPEYDIRPFSDEECLSCDDPGAYIAPQEAPLDTTVREGTATIFGTGALLHSEDPVTEGIVKRASEVLRAGVVGVSVQLSPDPACVPSDLTDEDAILQWAQENPDKTKLTIRHVAIVDTPAFNGAYLSIGDDDSVSGPLVFEGVSTSDFRLVPYQSVNVASSADPAHRRVPIIFDMVDGDHTGTVVGYIEVLERQDGVDMPVTASAKPITDTLPAAWFTIKPATKAEPIRISAPDADGYRTISGHVAPRGACHRSTGSCFTYPGDRDKRHTGFHTGAIVTLDNGTTIRPGVITMGGSHIDVDLYGAGIGADRIGDHRDDANRVFATVVAKEDAFGLAVAGVVPPSVPKSAVIAALGCAPSVELWPVPGGRTLVGVHMVPTPAWPVAASASGDVLKTEAKVLVDMSAAATEEAPAVPQNDVVQDQLAALTVKLREVAETQQQLMDAMAMLLSKGD